MWDTKVKILDLKNPIKIKDRDGFEISISHIIYAEYKTKEENIEVLGGVSQGDMSLINFFEWQSVWHEKDKYDTESYWYYASEFDINSFL